jgi:hypothetical protein
MLNAERYHKNNIADAATLPMSSLSLSRNRTPIIPSYSATLARYGRTLPLDLPQAPHMSSRNTPIIPSYRASLDQNSSSSYLGSQGFAAGFRNPSKPNLPNQKNFRYHPYGEGSNHKNNSLGFNDFDPLSRVDMNSFENLRNYVPPITTPDPICPSGNTNLDSTRESIIPSYYRANLDRISKSSCLDSQDFPTGFPNPSNNQNNFQYRPYGEGSSHRNNSSVFNDFDPLSRVDMNSFENLKRYVAPTPSSSCPSANVNSDLTRERTTALHNLLNYVHPIAAPPPDVPPIAAPSPDHPSGSSNLDSTRERTSEHSMFDIRNTDDWKMLMTCPNNCYEVIQNLKKELLLFKDDKNTFPSSLVIETGDANESDDDQLDLNLHL